jgi:hypothetical protein
VETHQGVFKYALALIKNIGIGQMLLDMITAVAKNDAIFTLFIAVVKCFMAQAPGKTLYCWYNNNGNANNGC